MVERYSIAASMMILLDSVFAPILKLEELTSMLAKKTFWVRMRSQFDVLSILMLQGK